MTTTLDEVVCSPCFTLYNMLWFHSGELEKCVSDFLKLTKRHLSEFKVSESCYSCALEAFMRYNICLHFYAVTLMFLVFIRKS
jgi:hypothetical protein